MPSSSARRAAAPVHILPAAPVLRMAVAAALAALATGCTSMMVPYLDPKPLNESATCRAKGTNGVATAEACDTVQRFTQTRDAVLAVQTEAHDSYADRARVNSISSALAFPLAGWALYRGVNPSGDNAQNNLLKWGLVVGAGYEAKNALLANSPESIYILSEARLSCVLDEAARYRLDFKDHPQCGAKSDALDNHTDALDAALAKYQGDEDLKAVGRALLLKARGATSQYNNMEVTLQAAADQMQAAARKIVSDTNSALKAPSISFNQATALMKSEMAAFTPAKAQTDTGGAHKKDDGRDALALQIAALATELNAFGRACVRPQPASPATFASCTSYSPAVPPAPTIFTTLGSDAVSLEVGGKLSFVATSTPSGTPWAMFAGDDKAAVAAMGTPQLITLSPNQTQVTLSYSNAVAAETKVILSLTTLGAAGNAKPIEITLKPAAAAVAPAAAPAPAAAAATPPSEAQWNAALQHKDKDKLFKNLSIDAPPPTRDQLIAQLKIQWRNHCGATNASDDIKLLRPAFLDAVIKQAKADPTAPYCK